MTPLLDCLKVICFFLLFAIAVIVLAASNENLRGAEPIQIRVQDCPVYARDGYAAAQMLRDGRTKEQIIEYWVERQNRFTPEQWPHALSLLERAFTTTLEPKEFGQAILKECIDNDGWLGRMI